MNEGKTYICPFCEYKEQLIGVVRLENGMDLKNDEDIKNKICPVCKRKKLIPIEEYEERKMKKNNEE